MEQRYFVTKTVYRFDDEIFAEFKKTLIGEYLNFAFIDDKKVTKEILSEKLCDYFEKTELRTGRSFDKFFGTYISEMESLVESRIAKERKAKKKGEVSTVPRARKYFEKACNLANIKDLNVKQISDFSRIIFCLYSSIIANDGNEIENFDYSVERINPPKLINSLKTEEKNLAINIGKKLKFDPSEIYDSDSCVFVLAVIMLYNIKNREIKGDY